MVHQYGGRKIVNIWNLLSQSSRLIICTKQSDIYISTFPDTLISKKVINHDISIYFFDKRDRSSVSQTAINLKFKMGRFPNEAHERDIKLPTEINIPSLMPDEDKNFGGILVLVFRK